MTENAPTITNLQDLLNYDVRRFTCAEIALKFSLEKWIALTSSLKLKTILQKYMEFAEEHIHKFENYFEAQHINSLSNANRVMMAFIEDTDETMNFCTDPEARDAGLLASIQGINHFKISLYGSAAAFAKELGLEEFASVFHEAEVNEKQIDDRLSQLAEYEINRRARAPIVLPR